MTAHDGARGDVRKRACICPVGDTDDWPIGWPIAVSPSCPAHNDWPIPPTFAHSLDDGQPDYRERIAQAILAEGARLAAQHHEASEAHGRIKTMAAGFAAVARGAG